MYLILNILVAKTIHRQGTGLGRKVLCFCILILLVVPFQLSGPLLQEGCAAERLPVVLLEDMKERSDFQELLQSIQASGFTPRTIREEDFSFNITAKGMPAVVVPVGDHVTPDAYTSLARYMNSGGRVILIPVGDAPDASVALLFGAAGLSVSGLAHVPQNLSFNWKGVAIAGKEHLHQATQLLMIQPSAQMDILATWGSDVPAIVTTNKGAVLNWNWGHQLSANSNTLALSKVIYPGKADPVIMLQQDEDAASKNPQAAAGLPSPTQSLNPLDPEVAPNPKFMGRKALIPVPPVVVAPKDNSPSTAAANPVTPAVTGVTIAKPAVIPIVKLEVSPLASPNAVLVKPGLVAKGPQATPAALSNKSGASLSDKAADGADNEVLNNILGLPSNVSLQSGTTTAGSATKTDGKPQQKYFSFLDPDAASVLAPSFDYGVYSMNLRKLDDYKRRVRDALEAGRQLSLDLPEDKVSALLKDSDVHKKKFEALYLAGQTQAGLDENTLAHHAALQALALTTTSPRVEGRAIWMDRGSIIASGGPEGLKKRMQKLHQAGINIVYFETVNAGFPIYPSQLVKHNPMVTNWDPLKVAVDEGHKQGMEVHAWVWAFAVGNRRHNHLINQPEDYAGPILNEGGMMSEALRNHEGGLSVDSHQHEFWLSPASPKGREFLINLYKEIVTKYDVDGLQLDYIRYPFQTSGNRMGFESVGREHFAQATGKSLDGMDDYTSRVWTAWKTYQVSSFVQQVSTTLKKIKPELKLSAAVFPMRREARIAAIQQDWETWIDNGWIDTLSPMSYTSDPERLQEMFEYVQRSPHKHFLVYPGIALQRLDGGQLVQHLEALRQKGGLGTTLFAGSHLDDDKIITLATGPYKQADSLTPHHDVVKSLQAILADYQQKLAILSKKGVLKDSPAAQLDALQTTLQRLSDALTDLGTGHPLSEISPQKLQVAQQRLIELQAASQVWSRADKVTHRYRAEYFERDLLLLTEIMGYTVDKIGLSPMTAITLPTSKIKMVNTGVAPLLPSEPTANLKIGGMSLP